jgi:hypothetical protein
VSLRKRIWCVVHFASAWSAVFGLLPSVGHAHEIRVSSYEMSETGGVVMLESDAPIGEPWLRVEAKHVRVWFPDLVDVARFDHQRDASEPIRSLVLRPGAQDSAVVRIEVGANRTLTRDNIQIVRDGQTARIRVSFPAPGRAPAATPSAVRAALTPAPAAKVADAPAASVSPVPPPSAAKPLFADTANPQPAAKPSAVGAVAKPASAKPTTLGFAGGSNQNLGLLMMISAVLLGIYACIKRFAKPRTIRTQDIEVLSARKLGKGSELLLVRALGSDHLLVTSAGRTERVASVPTPVEPPLLAPALTSPPSAAPATAPAPEETQAEGLGIITKLSSRSRLRKLLDAVDKETSDSAPPPAPPAPALPPPRASGRPAFGPELLSAINQHKLTGFSSLPSIANKQSDAVAGIARLRAGTRAN